MQQRRLRPGDVVDDYCPRERRITDHAIVAMIDDGIKQTRCVSCDAEHEYKDARVPAQRRKKAPAALFTQVLDGLQGPTARLAHAGGPHPAVEPSVDDEGGDAPSGAATAASAAPHDHVDARLADDTRPVSEEGPVRRPLIRAQLPRHEGQQLPARELPEFTIRQPGSGRGAHGHNGHGTRGRQRQGGQAAQGRQNGFGRTGEFRQGARQGQGARHGQGQGQGRGQQGARPNRSRRGKKH